MRLLKILLLPTAVVAVILFSLFIGLSFFRSSNASLKIDTPQVEGKVFLEGGEKGSTPFDQRNLKVGDYNLKIEGEVDGEAVEFSTFISLTSQNLTSINYDFGPSKEFSSGEIRTFRFGEGLSVVTNVGEAEIFLDGESIGKSPLSTTVSSGVHKVKVEKEGYFTRELEINLEPEQRLVLEIILAKNPFSKFERLEEGKVSLYNISSQDSYLTGSLASWASGVFFFDDPVKGVDFDVLVSNEGEKFYRNQEELNQKLEDGADIIIGYIGENGLTEKANNAVGEFRIRAGDTPPPPSQAPAAQVQIGATPTGFLNVRSGPGTGNAIITKVNPGQTYPLLEEQPGWFKIRVGEQEGWVSTQYATKL